MSRLLREARRAGVYSDLRASVSAVGAGSLVGVTTFALSENEKIAAIWGFSTAFWVYFGVNALKP